MKVFPRSTSELLPVLVLHLYGFGRVFLVKDCDCSGVVVVFSGFSSAVVMACPFDIVLDTITQEFGIRNFLDFGFQVVLDNDWG